MNHLKRQTDFSEENTVNLKEWFFIILSNWWLIGVCVFLGILSVWFYHRYAVPLYSVTTTIIINNEVESPGQMVLDKLDPTRGKVNVENEIGILKSFSLLQRVIDTLDYEVEYYTKGRVRATEQAAEKVPYKIKVIENNSINGSSISIDLLGENRFKLVNDPEKPIKGITGDIYTFPAVVSGPDFLFEVSKQGNDSVSAYIDHHMFVIYDPWSLAKSYRKSLDIKSQNKESSILEIGMESSIPEKARVFLDMLVDQYIQRELDQKNLTAEKTILFIDKQLESIGDTLTTVEERLQNFRSANKIVNISEEGMATVQKFQELEKLKSMEEVKIEYFDYILEYLNRNRNPASVVSPVTVGINNPVLDALVNNLNTLSAQLAQYEVNATESNPQVQTLQVQIQRVMKGVIENVENLKRSTNISIADLDSRIAETERNIDQLPKTERAYVNIQRRFNLSESLFIYLQEKKAEAGILKASNVPENNCLDPAIIQAKTFPKTMTNYIIGVFLGLLIPIVFIVFVNGMSDKISSLEEIQKGTNIPILGTLPYSHFDTELVVVNHPKSFAAESFRKLRASMKFMGKNKEAKVFKVTSFHSGEGKSYSAMNFACTLAATGKKVILLGMDLRKPKMFQEFGVPKDVGISNILIGDVSMEEAVRHTQIENLDIIIAGVIPPNPSELLSGPKTKELFEELRAGYDYVVIDTSPVGLVSDTIELTKYADITLFIVRNQVSPRNALAFLNDMVDKKLLSNVGLVMNGIDYKKIKNKLGNGYVYDSGYYDENA